jgi:hypothetical protein
LPLLRLPHQGRRLDHSVHSRSRSCSSGRLGTPYARPGSLLVAAADGDRCTRNLFGLTR